jgi:hypothetical protein
VRDPADRHARAAEPLVIVLLGTAVLLAGAPPALAHDWFTGLRDATGRLCCNGVDCGPRRVEYRDGRLMVDFPDPEGHHRWSPVPPEAVLSVPPPDDRTYACGWHDHVICVILPPPA